MGRMRDEEERQERVTVRRWRRVLMAAEGVDGLLKDATRPPGRKPLTARTESKVELISNSARGAPTGARMGMDLVCNRRAYGPPEYSVARTHDCLYELIRWMSQARLEGDPDEAEAEAAFEAIWQDRGPKDHAFAGDYRQLASRLVGALARSGAGRRFRKSEPLAIDFPHGRVVVEPNERAEMLDGKVVLRRVRTGYRTKEEYDGLEYTLYYLAGATHFGTAFVVEALHLTDGVMEFVEISDEKIGNRRDKTQTMLSGINAGNFPTEINAVTCPRCPHFFICPAAPKGPLTLS